MASSALKGIKSIRDLEFTNKVVFLRLDLNVPLEAGNISDETRILASLPTIKFLRDKGAKIVMCSHLGRPKGPGDKEYSLEPVAASLSKHLNAEVILFDDPASDGVKGLLQNLRPNQLILLENIRYVAGETKDSAELAQTLSSYSDIYINDAFGASHRAHASIHALPLIMKEKAMGFLIEKEISFLGKLLENPEKPYLAILGGAKVSDKIAVIEKLIDIVDGFLIGGAMAYTFLKAMGVNVGRSLVEADKIKYAAELIERVKARNKSFLLPVDHLVVKNLADTKSTTLTTGVDIPNDLLGIDIGPKTISQFKTAIGEAKTIFWNGPMGIFETPEFAKGTFSIAAALAENSGTKVVGGGDSASAAEASGYAEKMTHISTGGGASLEFLQGEKLPGIEVLRAKRNS